MIMKKLAIIASVLVAFVGLTACDKNKTTVNPEPAQIYKTIDGNWHLTSYFDLENPNDSGVDVYIKFYKSGKFVLFQKGLNNIRYVKFEGNFLLTDTATANVYTLSGVYADGEAFKNTYSLELNADASQMTLTNDNAASDRTVYTREETLPMEVLTDSAFDSRTQADSAVIRFF